MPRSPRFLIVVILVSVFHAKVIWAGPLEDLLNQTAAQFEILFQATAAGWPKPTRSALESAEAELLYGHMDDYFRADQGFPSLVRSITRGGGNGNVRNPVPAAALAVRDFLNHVPFGVEGQIYTTLVQERPYGQRLTRQDDTLRKGALQVLRIVNSHGPVAVQEANHSKLMTRIAEVAERRTVNLSEEMELVFEEFALRGNRVLAFDRNEITRGYPSFEQLWGMTQNHAGEQRGSQMRERILAIWLLEMADRLKNKNTPRSVRLAALEMAIEVTAEARKWVEPSSSFLEIDAKVHVASWLALLAKRPEQVQMAVSIGGSERLRSYLQQIRPSGILRALCRNPLQEPIKD